MGHAAHIVHWLFHETKIGGWVAGAGIVVAGLLAFLGNSPMRYPEDCAGGQRQIGIVRLECQKELDPEALVGDLVFTAMGGGIGIGIAYMAVALGVDKRKLGIRDD